MSEAVFVTAADGKILDYNAAATALMSACDVEDKTFPDWQRLQDDQANAPDVPAELSLTKADTGEACWFQARLLPLSADENTGSQYLILLHDITEHKRAEALAQAAEEMVSTAIRIKHEFVAIMSHELRTPLNSILGFSDLLLRGTYGAITTAQQDRLETIINSSKQLLDVINNILEVTQLEVGQTTLTPEPIALSPLLEECITTSEPKAIRRGLMLEQDIDDDLPLLCADPRRLRQIVLHLLDNAIKFTPSGNVTLRALPVQDDLPVCLPSYFTQDHERWLLISVSDTGIGIDEKYWQAIFSPFHQADSSHTRVYDGCGLGLAIVKRLVTCMGGFIHLDSHPGEGSTFSVLLPVHNCACPDVYEC